MKKILIVIPVLAKTTHEERLLKRCLESIKKHEPGMLPHTVLVHEKISNDCKWLKSYPVRNLRKKTDPSYAVSINMGVQAAAFLDYTHVLTVNTDVEFMAPFLVPLVASFRKADIVGGLLMYPNGKIQSAGWHYREDGVPLEYEKGQHLNSATLYKQARYVGGITGALQGFSIECGCYDQSYGLSYEDVDFCVLNLLKGRKIFYNPDIKAVHVESATRGYFVGAKELESYKLYKRKVSKITPGKLNLIVEETNKNG